MEDVSIRNIHKELRYSFCICCSHFECVQHCGTHFINKFFIERSLTDQINANWK